VIFKDYMARQIIHREFALSQISRLLRAYPGALILGPRQCGKTTLARIFAESQAQVTFFDLERHKDRRLLENAESVLLSTHGIVVIDEVQRIPELFETLRFVIDHPQCSSKFLLLGSVSPTLIKGVTESLAGRVGMMELGSFTIREVSEHTDWRTLWYRGGFPRSTLAQNNADSVTWRENFVNTFLERDVPQFGYLIPPDTLRRFWTMLAHYHGQVWNSAEFARAIGENESTARRYLDILSSAYMVRVIPPWFENLKKRQVKSPKVYVRDCGLLHSLLELDSLQALSAHPNIGASFEGLALEQILQRLQSRNFYFWGTHAGAELDLLVSLGGNRYGFEMKYSDKLGTTKSMRTTIADMNLEHLWIVHPGIENHQLDNTISTISIEDVSQLVDQLKTGSSPPFSKDLNKE